MLSFTINWRQANDKIYLAHSYPYTYTRMLNMMKNVVTQVRKDNEELNGHINIASANNYNSKKESKYNKNKKEDSKKNGINIEIIRYGKSIGNRDLIAYCLTSQK